MSPQPRSLKKQALPTHSPLSKPPAAPTAGTTDEEQPVRCLDRSTPTGGGCDRQRGAVVSVQAGLTYAGPPLVWRSVRAQKGTGPALRAGA